MAAQADFWNRMAAKYARDPVADEASYQYKLRKTQEYFMPDARVFEFACGTGSTAIVHAPFVKSILAVDFSKEMIGIARKKALAAGIGNVNFEVSAIEDFTIPDEGYDVVMGHSILHLVRNRGEVLAKVFSLVKPGGVFVSSTACIDDISPILKWVLPVGTALGLVPHVGAFRSDELIAEIGAAGFEVEHRWRPRPSAAVFIVARRPAERVQG